MSGTAEATLRVPPPAGTSLSGQLVRLDGTPIPNYTVRIEKQATRTDGAGNFLLKHLKVSQTYEDLLIILDGRTARAPSGHLYPVYEKLLEYAHIKPNRPNRLTYRGPMWIPTMDPRNGVRVDSSRERVVKFPHLPGLEIAVPAGTTFKDIDGRPVSTLHDLETPLAQAQMHLSHLPAGVSAAALFSLQFGGITPSKPVQVTVPNRGNIPPGTKVALWFYDVTKDGWYSPGQGTVTDDGTKIVPDPGVSITRFGCLADPSGEDEDEECDEECDEEGEDKVDVTSGLLIHRMTDLVVQGRLPIVFTRIYRSKSLKDGPFGKGHSHSYATLLASATAPAIVQLVLPTNKRIPFVLEGSTWVHRATQTFWGAIYTPPPTFLSNVFKVTLKDGTVWEFRPGGFLSAIRDRHGNQLTLHGYAQEVTTAIATPDGRLVRLDYDGQGRIVRLTDPLDQTVSYAYNSAGDLETVTDPSGGVTRYTYEVTPDGFHNLKSITLPRGITKWTMDYDPVTHRVIRQTRADGGVWQFSYTTSGSTVIRTVVTDPRGKTRTYDIQNKYIAAVTNHLGQTTTITRDSVSRHITQIDDHLQRRTIIGYDAQKNVRSVTRYKDPPANAQPLAHQFTYDTAHYNLLTSYTDPLGHTWTFGLDAAGKNVVSITNPLNNTWTINRLATGEPQQVTDPLSHSTTFAYNSLGLLQSVTDHLGNAASYTYDQLGRRITAMDPRGFTARSTYDRLNRLIAVANPLGQAVRFEYDPNSNLTEVTDPRGGVIQYTYTNMDLLATRVDQLGSTETYTYDAQGGGTLASFRDRKNQLTTWAPYDDLNRPTTLTYHDGSTLTYNYDSTNRLYRLDDSVSGSITWGYDPLDRRISETTPQGTVTYVPDDASRRTQMIVAGQPPG